MWKNIIIVILLITSIILGVLFYLCNSKIKSHMKNKENDLIKRESELIKKEKCNSELLLCKKKIKEIKNLIT